VEREPTAGCGRDPAGGIVPEAIATGAITAGAKAIGKPDFQVLAEEQYAPTYVGRVLVDMLTKGEITQKEYEQAMYQQQGDTYDKALNRASALSGATNIAGMYTSLRPRQMLDSEPLIEQAKSAHTQIEQYIKGSGADAATAQAIRDNFSAAYPWYYAYAARYGTPEERAQRQDTDTYFAQSEQLRQERDAKLAELPVGYKGPEADAIWGDYNTAMERLRTQTASAQLESTAIKTPAEREQQAKDTTIAALLQLEPKYGDGSQWQNYAQYEAAHQRWEMSLPELSVAFYSRSTCSRARRSPRQTSKPIGRE